MIVELESQFEGLSTREGFNTSLRHFKAVNEIIGEFTENVNLADILNELIEEQNLQPPQIKPVLNALLIDKYGYQSHSFNAPVNIEDFSAITEETQGWTRVDLVLTYYSPELGLQLVNPKNAEHWSALRIIKKNELVTLYCGAFTATDSKPRLYTQALGKLTDLLSGKKFKTPAAFQGGAFTQDTREKVSREPAEERRVTHKAKTTNLFPAAKKAQDAEAASPPAAPAAPTAAPASGGSSGKRKMTPLYGIPVTNELFHNGNVEAWKKIIESYETFRTGLKVFVFYDGEPIHDLNTLFKWGKVKRGTSIMVAVAGEEIRDVSKLQKYLRQGASHMFEAFLKGHPHKVLKLF